MSIHAEGLAFFVPTFAGLYLSVSALLPVQGRQVVGVLRPGLKERGEAEVRGPDLVLAKPTCSAQPITPVPAHKKSVSRST